jgi:hypothetical protein
MLDAATLERARSMIATLPESDELTALQSVEELIAYTATAARAEDQDEADAAELLVRLADLGPDAVRRAASVLGRLGYGKVAIRLREIAGRRRRNLRTLV